MDAPVTITSRPARGAGVAAQSADETHVLLDTTSGRYFTLDEVGGRVWELCDGRSIEAIAEVLCAEFDAPRAQIQADVLELMEELRDEGLVDAQPSRMVG